VTLNLDKSTWKRVAFGDVVANLNITVKDPAAAGLERVIAMEHLEPGELKISRWGSLEDGTTFTRRVRPGQTLFGKRRAYQRKVAFAEFDAICSSDILVFEADKDWMLREFLPFLVQSNGFYDHALGTSAGSLSPRTNWRDLANYEFDLPPLVEQERIADLLWAMEVQRQNLMEVTKYGRAVRQAFIDDFLAKATMQYPLRRLDGLTTKIVDGVHKRPSYTESGIPFLTVENLTRGDGIDFKDVRYISPADHNEFIRRTNPEQGDVLVSKDGTLGVARVVNTDIPFSIFVSVALLKPQRSLILPGYLCSYFDSGHFRATLAGKTSGSALKHIHLVDFKSMQIPAPPLDIQQNFIDELACINTGVDAINAESVTLASLRSAVLAESFGDVQ
jgi:type I restriction enzyme S subunit